MRKFLSVLLAVSMAMGMSLGVSAESSDSPQYEFRFDKTKFEMTYDLYKLLDVNAYKDASGNYVIHHSAWSSEYKEEIVEAFKSNPDNEEESTELGLQLEEKLNDASDGDSTEFDKAVYSAISGLSPTDSNGYQNNKDSKETLNFSRSVFDFIQRSGKDPTYTVTVMPKQTDRNEYQSYMVDPGYYLLNLRDNDTAQSLFILQTAFENNGNPVIISPKISIPSLDAKVSVESTYLKDDKPVYTKASNVNLAQVGDTIKVVVESTMPQYIEQFQQFPYIIHGKLQNMLFMNEDDVSGIHWNVQLVRGSQYYDVTKSFKAWGKSIDGTSDGYDIKTAPDCKGHNVHFGVADIKKLELSNGSEIVSKGTDKLLLTFEVQLDADSFNAGYPGNEVVMTLEYAVDPNDDGAGRKVDSPWLTEASTGGRIKTATTVDNAKIYSYNVNVKHQDKRGEPVTGAQFTLKKYKGLYNASNNKNGYSWDVVNYFNAEGKSDYDFKGLGAGIYMLEETVVPEGKLGISPVYFEISHDGEESNSVNVYRLKAIPKNSGWEFLRVTPTVNKVGQFIHIFMGDVKVDNSIEEDKMVDAKSLLNDTNAMGVFKTTVIDGLGITSGEGDISDVVGGNGDGSGDGTGDNEADKNDPSGSNFLDPIISALLPTTGGIGTVIFYIAGLVILVGLGVVVFVKGRKENK